jgi:hypothetical protein
MHINYVILLGRSSTICRKFVNKSEIKVDFDPNPLHRATLDFGDASGRIYRVSHNTWDYKNALGRPLNHNVQSWEVSHFEAKDHTFQTRGVRL